MKFGLSEDIYKRIKNIIIKYPYCFKVFGSRARGDFKNYSDIDIAIIGKVSEKDEYEIRNEFDLLDIVYTIDLVFVNDYTKKELIESIMKEGVEII